MIDTNIKSLNILELSRETDNIYKTVSIVGRRSNQVASQLKKELMHRLSEFGSTSETMEEITENREQIEVARLYEQLPKPTLIALHDYLNGLVRFKDNESEI